MRFFAISFLAIVAGSASLPAQQVGPDIDRALKDIEALGGTYQRAVVSVSFSGLEKYTGDEIVKLAPLRYHLRSLSLYRTPVTDQGLQDLDLSELTKLDLRSTRITDNAFEYIARLKRLRALYLSGTAITGARLDELKHLSELTHLTLDRTKLNLEGVKRLKLFPQLERLALDETSIDNACVAELAQLTQLDELDLRSTKIQGAGGIDAAWAAAHPELTTLYLGFTRVDDRCIPGLASLPKLGTLAINHTLITPAGLRKFSELRRRGEEDEKLTLVVSAGQVTPEVHAELSKTFERINIHVVEDKP